MGVTDTPGTPQYLKLHPIPPFVTGAPSPSQRAAFTVSVTGISLKGL